MVEAAAPGGLSEDFSYQEHHRTHALQHRLQLSEGLLFSSLSLPFHDLILITIVVLN
jgi:hypothetical protein